MNSGWFVDEGALGSMPPHPRKEEELAHVLWAINVHTYHQHFKNHFTLPIRQTDLHYDL
jgi:hypothetical protein